MMRRSRMTVATAFVLTLALPIVEVQASPVQFNISWRVENTQLNSPDAQPQGCSGLDMASQYVPLSPEWYNDPYNSSVHFPNPGAFFAVNGLKLLTLDRTDGASGTPDDTRYGRGPSGQASMRIWWQNTYDSRFSSSLLHSGSANKFDFDSYGNLFNTLPPYVATTSNIDSEIYLESNTIGSRLLLNEFKCNWFQRKTFSIGITLAEIDPMLAAQLNALEMAIAAAKTKLLGDASRIENVPATIARLNELSAALHSLFGMGFDQITAEAIDALFTAFLDVVPEGFAESIADLFENLKEGVEQLRGDLEEQVSQLRDATASLNGTLLDGATSSGFDPSNPGTFLPPPGLPELSDVGLPDVPTGEWHPDVDPYKAYADDVLVRLHATMDANGVASRGTFLDVIAEWEHNQALYEYALDAKAQVTPEEYLAFARQRQRVAEFIHTQMDEEWWFRDTPVPHELRGLFDTLAAFGYYDMAKRLHRNLNEWRGSLTPQQGAIVEMLIFADATLRELHKVHAVTAVERLLSIVRVLVELGKIGIQFTPVGDVLAACEAITGLEGCDPNGRHLSATERVIAGSFMFIAGVAATWKLIASRMTGHAAKETLDLAAGVLAKAERRAKTKLPITKAGWGRWEGLRGESRWFSEKAEVNAITHGEGIPYKGGYVDFSKWQFREPFKIKGLKGTDEDWNIIYDAIKGRYGEEFNLTSRAKVEEWLSTNKLTPHHVEDCVTIQLVPTPLHKGAPHIGGASRARDAGNVAEGITSVDD